MLTTTEISKWYAKTLLAFAGSQQESWNASVYQVRNGYNPEQGAALFLFAYALGKYDPTPGAINYLTEKQVASIIHKANSIMSPKFDRSSNYTPSPGTASRFSFGQGDCGCVAPVIVNPGGGNGGGTYIPPVEYTYIVGGGEQGDPADGAVGLRDSRLLGKTFTVKERGTGDLTPPGRPGAEWIYRNDAGGGFDFIDPDKKFYEGGRYTLTVQS